MAPLNPKATDTGRGRHPDLDEHGDVLPDAFVDPAERDFARLGQDEARWSNFMERVAANQSLEPIEVQHQVQGQVYAPDGSLLQGYREYQQDLRNLRQWHAQGAGKSVFVDDADVRAMSTEEFDACFDANGRPLPHVYYHANRARRVDEAMDPWTAHELYHSRPRGQQP